MKKRLLPALLASALVLSGTVFVPNVFTNPPAIVAAQEEINFDQGDLSDEEYLNSVLTSFRSAEKIHSSQKDDLAAVEGQENAPTEQETILIHDGSVPARKTTSIIGDIETSFYYFTEGMAFNPVELHGQMVPFMATADPDYASKVEQLTEEIGEGTLVLDESYAGEIVNPFEISFPEDQTFSSTAKDGSIVSGTVENYELSAEEAEILASILPEGTVFNITFEVDPENESITLHQETVFPEVEESTEGVSMFEGSLETTTVYTLTDESVPALTDFETITFAEYNEIITEIGLDPAM